jgi:hypothetical protein
MATKKGGAAAKNGPEKREPMADNPSAAPALADANQSTAGVESTQEGAAPQTDATNTSETTEWDTASIGRQITDNTGEAKEGLEPAPAPGSADGIQKEEQDAGLDVNGAAAESDNGLGFKGAGLDSRFDHAADDAEQNQPEEVALVAMCREEPIHEGGPTEADVHPDEVDNWLAAGWVIEE